MTGMIVSTLCRQELNHGRAASIPVCVLHQGNCHSRLNAGSGSLPKTRKQPSAKCSQGLLWRRWMSAQSGAHAGVLKPEHGSSDQRSESAGFHKVQGQLKTALAAGVCPRPGCSLLLGPARLFSGHCPVRRRVQEEAHHHAGSLWRRLAHHQVSSGDGPALQF